MLRQAAKVRLQFRDRINFKKVQWHESARRNLIKYLKIGKDTIN